MERREKLLAIVAGSLALLLVVYYAMTSISDSITRAKAQVNNNKTAHRRLQIAESELYSMEGFIAERAYIALPANTNLAQVEYGPWLESFAPFGNLTVGPVGRPESNLGGKYHTLRFRLQGDGTLEDVTDFLYDFYSYDLAHRITSLTVNPPRGREQDYTDSLSIVMTVEAISMPNAVMQSLREVTRREDYYTRDQFEQVVQENILDRNLFAYNAEPILNNISPKTVGPNDEEISFSVSARDPEGRQLTYSLDNAPRGMRIDSRTGEITFRPSNRDEEASYEDIVVTVEDIGMKPRLKSTSFDVLVAKAAPAADPEPEIPFDATRYSYVTNIRDSSSGPMVVIDNRPMGEYHTLRPDESVEISGITFTVVSIDFENERITVSVEDTEHILKLGDSLAGLGTPVGAEFRTNSRGGFGTRGGFGNRGGGGNRGFGNRGNSRGSRGRRGGE